MKIKKASLIGKGHIITIDLVDGHGEVDGRNVYPPVGHRPPEANNRNLIYYRKVQQKNISDIMLKPDGSKIGNLIADWFTRVEPKPVVRYYIGWQVNHNGKNYKWELGVD